jgi:hypothetical protein
MENRKSTIEDSKAFNTWKLRTLSTASSAFLARSGPSGGKVLATRG